MPRYRDTATTGSGCSRRRRPTPRRRRRGPLARAPLPAPASGAWRSGLAADIEGVSLEDEVCALLTVPDQPSDQPVDRLSGCGQTVDCVVVETVRNDLVDLPAKRGYRGRDLVVLRPYVPQPPGLPAGGGSGRGLLEVEHCPAQSGPAATHGLQWR